MKILWLSHLVPYPPKGGVLQRSYNLVKQVTKVHQIDLLAFNQKNLIKPLFKNYEQGLKEAEQELSSFCHRFKFLPITSDQTEFGKELLAVKSLFSKDPYTINWLKSDLMVQELRSWLSETRYDLVHFDTISLAPYLRLITNEATSLNHNDIESQTFLNRVAHESNFLKKLYFLQEGLRLKKYEKIICSNFDLHITCSIPDTLLLRDISHSIKIEEVPNGVDIDYFNPQNREQDNRQLIFAGTMNFYPNVEAMNWFIDNLWQPLKLLIPGIKFDLIGANPPERFLKLSSTDPQFKTHGFVDDIRPLLERAALYICPIQDGGGTKLKILDALAMSKTIICHPIAAKGINVTDQKNVVFASSPEQYLAKIKLLLEDAAKRTEIGNAGRELVTAHYSFDSIGKSLAHLFQQTVSNKKRGA